MLPELTWAPNRQVFLRRVAYSAILTFVALSSVGVIASVHLGLTRSWIWPTAGLITLGFVIDDVLRWHRRRFERWVLQDDLLITETAEETQTIPLHEIDRVKARFFGQVNLRLTSGMSIVLSNLPHPHLTARAISERLPPRQATAPLV